MVKLTFSRVVSRLLASYLSLNFLACRENLDKNHLSYLIDRNYQCFSPSVERLSLVEEKLPSGFITGYPADQMPTVMNRIALISDRDLNYLVANFISGSFEGISPGNDAIFGVAGDTTLRPGVSPGGNTGLVATSITTGASLAGFALQHEIGHAVEILAADYAVGTDFSNFPGSLDRLFDEVRTRREIRSYAKSSPNEAWAEAYANFYCSPESNDFIKNNLPFTNQFLKSILVAPLWETSIPNNFPDTRSPSSDTTENVVPNDNPSEHERQNAAVFSRYLDQIVLALETDPGEVALDPISQNPQESNVLNQPFSLDKQITLALVDLSNNTEEAGFMISTSKNIHYVELCIGTQAVCAEDIPPEVRRPRYRFSNFKQMKDRKFFMLQTIKKHQEKTFGTTWHVSGYDKSVNLIASRKFEISSK